MNHEHTRERSIDPGAGRERRPRELRRKGPAVAGVPGGDTVMTRDHEPRSALDPAALGWEDELRAGAAQDAGDTEAQGGSAHVGSVEPELAVVRLLLHARAPSELSAAREDALWSEISRAITPVPWWRRRALLWAAPAIAAAAIVVFVMPRGPQAPTRTAGSAELLEQQFSLLAPAARAEQAHAVDDARGSVRARLLTEALATPTAVGASSVGGAP